MTVILNVDGLVLGGDCVDTDVELAPAVLDDGVVAARCDLGLNALTSQGAAEDGDVR
jgi:hypothetical protein